MTYGQGLTNLVAEAVRGSPCSVRALAREAGVPDSTLVRIVSGERGAAPAVADAVAGALERWSGECARLAQTIRKAHQGQLATAAKAEQPAAVQKLAESSKGKARHTPVARVLTGTDGRRGRTFPNPVPEQFARAVQMLGVGAEIIGQHAEAIAASTTLRERRREWIDALRQIRTTIARVITSLEKAA